MHAEEEQYAADEYNRLGHKASDAVKQQSCRIEAAGTIHKSLKTGNRENMYLFHFTMIYCIEKNGYHGIEDKKHNAFNA